MQTNILRFPPQIINYLNWNRYFCGRTKIVHWTIIFHIVNCNIAWTIKYATIWKFDIAYLHEWILRQIFQSIYILWSGVGFCIHDFIYWDRFSICLQRLYIKYVVFLSYYVQWRLRGVQVELKMLIHEHYILQLDL